MGEVEGRGSHEDFGFTCASMTATCLPWGPLLRAVLWRRVGEAQAQGLMRSMIGLQMESCRSGLGTWQDTCWRGLRGLG